MTPTRAIIIANGELHQLDSARALIRADDRLIAADGGAHHCRALGLLPQVVIGDLDSNSSADIAALEAAGVCLIRHPARKDQTDLELALAWAVANGASEILILGALGGRWDQTLANMLLLTLPALDTVPVRLVDGNQQIGLVRGPGSHTLSGAPGDTVSLIPVGGDAQGVTTTGLEYPLANGTIRLGSTLGVSNTLIESRATITLHKGQLIYTQITSQTRTKKENPT